MSSWKEILSISLAVNLGLLFYTLLLIFLYWLFFSGVDNNNLDSSLESGTNSSKETIKDLDDVDFLEDVEETV
jgi:hypothetical protein